MACKYATFLTGDVITVCPQYFLKILNAKYLCNNQELSPKTFYILYRFWDILFQDGAIKWCDWIFSVTELFFGNKHCQILLEVIIRENFSALNVVMRASRSRIHCKLYCLRYTVTSKIKLEKSFLLNPLSREIPISNSRWNTCRVANLAMFWFIVLQYVCTHFSLSAQTFLGRC